MRLGLLALKNCALGSTVKTHWNSVMHACAVEGCFAATAGGSSWCCSRSKTLCLSIFILQYGIIMQHVVCTGAEELLSLLLLCAANVCTRLEA